MKLSDKQKGIIMVSPAASVVVYILIFVLDRQSQLLLFGTAVAFAIIVLAMIGIVILCNLDYEDKK